ncbi:ATP-binding protein, partial [Mycobacterium tuberculosis]|nr:ATP-binding protein [Mycobacterium tuberculosis]
LGLSIVQALIAMHDGTFDLKSKLREGTEVVVTVPKTRVLDAVPAVDDDKRPRPVAPGPRPVAPLAMLEAMRHQAQSKAKSA